MAAGRRRGTGRSSRAAGRSGRALVPAPRSGRGLRAGQRTRRPARPVARPVQRPVRPVPRRVPAQRSVRAPGRGPGESYLAQHPWAPLVWMWRHRWPLAPVAVAGGAVAGAVCAPAPVALGLTAAAAAAQGAAQVPALQTIAGRAWLSTRERTTAARGLAAAAGWVTVADMLPGLGWRGQGLLLAAALGWPAQQWWTSRRARPRAEALSPAAAAMVAQWAEKVAGPGGPKALRGAVVLPGSVSEPVEGGVAMVVRLDGVHAANATGTQLRRAVEVAMGLPADTVTLSALRDDGPADRLQVLLAPHRSLEKAPTVWPGPIIEDDGALPVAVDAAGATIKIHLFNKDGVEHGLISGTSGTGKGGTTVVVIVPGVLAGRTVFLYADGKHGMSAPEIHPLATRLALTTQQAGQVIDIAHAIMCGRELRYGKAGLKRFIATGPDANPDPIITLLLDEATTLNRALPASKIKKVMEIAERGRACGVQLIQVSQSVRADMIIGGVPVRDLLTGNGFSIAHKPGGSSAARLASDGIQVTGLVEALQALPGGQPGMGVITRRGEVLATSARVFDAEKPALALVEQWLADGHRPLELTGDDLAAAGPAYTTGWNDPDDQDEDDDEDPATTSSGTTGSTPAGDAGAVVEVDVTGGWVYQQLDAAGIAGVTAAALVALDGSPSRATIYRDLNRLLGQGKAVNHAGTWRLAGLPDPTDDDAGEQLDAELDEVARTDGDLASTR